CQHIPDVLKVPIGSPAIPKTCCSLRVFLIVLLRRVQPVGDATYFINRDVIEITSKSLLSERLSSSVSTVRLEMRVDAGQFSMQVPFVQPPLLEVVLRCSVTRCGVWHDASFSTKYSHVRQD